MPMSRSSNLRGNDYLKLIQFVQIKQPCQTCRCRAMQQARIHIVPHSRKVKTRSNFLLCNS